MAIVAAVPSTSNITDGGSVHGRYLNRRPKIGAASLG